MAKHLKPSLDKLREILREHDAALCCTVCRGEGFSISYAAPLDAGPHQYYGNVRLNRTQVTCSNCGHVMSFDLDALQDPEGRR